MNNVKEYNSLPSIQLVENRGWTTTSLHGEKTYVPADWTTPRMKDLVSFHRGNGIPKGAVAEDGTYPCVLYGQLFTTYGRTIFKAVSKTSSPGNVEGMVGDVLVPSSTTTTGEDLACASALLISGVFIGSDINILRPKTDLDSTWLARKITSMKREVGSVATGLTIIHVYNKNLAELQLQAPPPAEQTLIAQVLTAQESQVHDLRKLAQAERQRLTWLSDELLSGRLRVEEDPTAESVVVSRNEKGEPVEVLPGVRVVENTEWKTVEVNGKTAQLPESWTVACIDQITELKKTKKTGGQYIGLENIEPKTGRYVKTIGAKMVEEAAAFSFEEGDLLYGKLRPYLQKAWVAEFEGTCSTEFFVLKPKVNTKFVHLHLLSDSIAAIADGTSDGTRMPRTNWGAIGAAELGLPTLPEQTLIAQVLTAQETQVAEIERLADLEQQRFEWLSNELLSGRIRVKTTKED